MNSIGAATSLHPDFGAGLWEGAPDRHPVRDRLRAASRRSRSTTRRYGDESDPGPYPVPANAPIEGGAASDGDRHVLVVDRGACLLYELYRAFPHADGSWEADSGASLRPELARAAAGRLDLGRRRGPADLPRPRALRRGGGRRDPPRAALHGPAARARRTSGRRGTSPRRRRAAPLPPMGQRFRLKAELRHLALLAAGPGDPAGAQEVRDDPGRQRLALVHLGRAERRLGQRRAGVASCASLKGSDFEAVDVSSLFAHRQLRPGGTRRAAAAAARRRPLTRARPPTAASSGDRQDRQVPLDGVGPERQGQDRAVARRRRQLVRRSSRRRPTTASRASRSPARPRRGRACASRAWLSPGHRHEQREFPDLRIVPDSNPALQSGP